MSTGGYPGTHNPQAIYRVYLVTFLILKLSCARLRKKILLFLDQLDSKPSLKNVFKIQARLGSSQNRHFSEFPQILSQKDQFSPKCEVDQIFCFRVLIRLSEGTYTEKMSQI